jgi:Fe2+ or Zn2+ uptake regulation protein
MKKSERASHVWKWLFIERLTKCQGSYQLEDELYEATVFEIIGHNLEFTGLCPECSKKIHTIDH